MAEILFFHKGGRDQRREAVMARQAPADFFYGMLELEKRGYRVADLSTTDAYSGPLAAFYRANELTWSKLTGVGIRRHLIRLLGHRLGASSVAMSFTDGFSASLGLAGRAMRNRGGGRPFLIGCFHALSDLETKSHPLMSGHTHRLIGKALSGLDHVACFGPADREYAITRYALDPARISVIPFGVDTDFWCPDESVAADQGFLSIGSDPNRDFETLCRVISPVPVRILTRLHVKPRAGSGVELLKGDFWNSSFDDCAVREMYRRALGVVVPLKDVFQPTGYSVTLQAMACGKPVILSNIKGLWDKDRMRHEENCLLVPPDDPVALQNALERLAGDAMLRVRLGQGARAMVEAHFNIQTAGDGTEALVRMALASRADSRA